MSTSYYYSLIRKDSRIITPKKGGPRKVSLARYAVTLLDQETRLPGQSLGYVQQWVFLYQNPVRNWLSVRWIFEIEPGRRRGQYTTREEAAFALQRYREAEESQ